jgi:hypothetical protein
MSKTTRHTLETTFEFDGENEHNIKLTYFYTPPTRQRAASYSNAGEPPEEAPEVETISLEVDGKPATFEQFDDAQTSDSLWDKMIAHAEKNL